MTGKFNKYTCDANCTIAEVYKHIKKNRTTFAIIIKKKSVIGTFTLGDYKESLFKGTNLNNKITTIAKKKFFKLEQGYDKSLLKKSFRKNTIDFIPILKKSTLVDIVFKKQIFKLYKKNKEIDKNKIAIVIMAGGHGKRLLPVSSVLPKALMPFPDKPIIYEIISNFINQGYKNLYVTLNYKADLIRSYLAQFSNFKINYITEKKSMGTCGSLNNKSLLKYQNILVTNCDTYLKTNTEDLLSDHLSFKNDFTVVTSVKKHTFDYGVCELDDNGEILKINEKPKFEFLINTGVYLINTKILNMIKKNQKFDMDQFINLLLKNKKNISTSTVSIKDFIDIGQWKFYHDYLKNNK